ncbi:MAG: transcription antitermination factor NusB [Clostridia bacterium]|nr:transcription antitermination factor NusB [Clostridia bacterium]
MNRHQAREALLTLVFEKGFLADGENADFADEFDIMTANREIETNDYMRDCYIGIMSHAAELEGKLAQSAIGWKTERMSRMSRSILTIAAYEMLYMEDVPYSVAINEAVELAKTYDHDDAPRFINGVLNKIAEKEGLKN